MDTSFPFCVKKKILSPLASVQLELLLVYEKAIEVEEKSSSVSSKAKCLSIYYVT